MHKILTIKVVLGLLLALGFGLNAQKKSVTLELSYLEPYCGGARPSDEIIAEAQKPKPYAGKKLILLSASGKADTLVTDAKGKLKVKLKRGDYTLVEIWRYYKKSCNGAPLEHFDADCLKVEWAKTIALISVGKKKTKISFTGELTNYCEWNIPCLLEAYAPPVRE